MLQLSPKLIPTNSSTSVVTFYQILCTGTCRYLIYCLNLNEQESRSECEVLTSIPFFESMF